MTSLARLANDPSHAPTRSLGSGVFARRVLALALPLMLSSIIIAGYRDRFNSRRTISQYFNGVYASRVLGRECVVGIADAFNKIGSLLWHATSTGLIVGWMVTNGVAFVIAALLLYSLSAAKSSALTLVYVVVIFMMAVSATVTTPYDFLSYALILAVFIEATRGSRGRALLFMILAVATRESALLVVPILALSFVRPTHDNSASLLQLLRDLRDVVRGERIIWLLTAAGLTTYATLKIVAMEMGHKLHFVQHVAIGGHLSTAGVLGALSALLMVVVLRVVLRASEGVEALDRRSTLLWLSASPYLVVCAGWGIWSEAPRLVMPLLLGEFLLAVTTAPGRGLRLNVVESTERSHRPTAISSR